MKKPLPADEPDMLDTDYYRVKGMEFWENTVDDLDQSSMQAITWSPAAGKYPSSQPKRQYDSLVRYVAHLFPICFRRWFIVPEINENGNVHLHGWVIIKDKVKMYRVLLPKMKTYGFTCVKSHYRKQPINFDWQIYICCELDETKQIINGAKSPLMLHENNASKYMLLPGANHVPKLKTWEQILKATDRIEKQRQHAEYAAIVGFLNSSKVYCKKFPDDYGI